jgi:hypothetical protein
MSLASNVGPVRVGELAASCAAGSCMATNPSACSNGPVVLYEEHNGTTVVLAPHNNFMTESHNLSTDALSFGPGGLIASLPPGFTQETILVVGTGISATVLEWGRLARAVHSPAAGKLSDVTLEQLGYWTDNGAAYYWYNYGDKVTPLQPQQTLVAVLAKYKRLQVPVRYVQLDAWWYKTVTCPNAYACACIANFTPDFDFFNHSTVNKTVVPYPSGIGPWFNTSLRDLAAEVGIVGWSLYHNYFCPTNDYENSYTFVLDGYKQFSHVVPEQADGFFTEVISARARKCKIFFPSHQSSPSPLRHIPTAPRHPQSLYHIALSIST